VPCWIYLRGDPDAITSEEAADVVLRRVEDAEPETFIQFALRRLAHDDDVRTGYVRAGEIVAVLPMHPLQAEADLDDPPEWYESY
jgi:hypothetical protein